MRGIGGAREAGGQGCRGRRALLLVVLAAVILPLGGCWWLFVNQLPIAAFTLTPSSGPAPLRVRFDATGSRDPDGSIASYDWDFDDGQTSTQAAPTHTFHSAEARTFVVRLTVTDDDGATGSTSRLVRVEAVQAVDVPDNDEPTVRIIAAPTIGPSPLEVTFDARGSWDPDGSIVSYGWDFGDGTSGQGSLITHEFAVGVTSDFFVNLAVTDDAGGTALGSVVITVTVDQPTAAGPRAGFTQTDPDEVEEGVFQVEFDPADSVHAPGHPIIAYVWDFGDGEPPGTEATPVIVLHDFLPGEAPYRTYVVRLTVIDDRGLQDTAFGNVTVANPPD